MKLPEPVITSITTVGGVIFRYTIDVSGVVFTESTEFRDLTSEELELVQSYGLQLAVATFSGNQAEIGRIQDILKALRAKPKTKPATRGGHELA